MAPEVAFSSIQFLTMPRRQQNELIYSLLSPIARSAGKLVVGIHWLTKIIILAGIRFKKDVEISRSPEGVLTYP